MLCFYLKNTNPFFCLAAEEYLLKKFNEDIFMLWQSHDTVVVGKHQNAMGEINFPFVRENNITVARRISGGGTVFHDKGNVNFAFIKSVGSTQEIGFKKFTEPIVKALEALGVDAETSGRNDLLVDGKKISGNAEHVYKKRVLHHGTLLFSSDLKNLGEAIHVKEGKYQSKAIQSNRSEVVNISNYLKDDLNIQDFIQHLLNFQITSDDANIPYRFSNTEVLRIQELADQKFASWEWRFGYSPKYSFQNSFKNRAGEELKIGLYVEGGKIKKCDLEGNIFSPATNKKLSDELIDNQHRFEIIKKILKSYCNPSDELINAFF